MSRRKNTRVQYAKLVPPDSFLGAYLSYLNPLETPHAYDFWTGLFVLSSGLGRTIHVNRPGAPVYLNIYAILVAESGITRKSTAVRIATKFSREIHTENPLLIETKATPELITDVLNKQSKRDNHSGVVISVSELATFLGRERYMESMPTLLTDLYDCPEHRIGGGTLGRNSPASGNTSFELKNVFVSFLSASTPSWLLRAVNPDVIEGGFTSRVCFIVAEETKRRESWPEPLNDGIYREIVERLRSIQQRASEIRKIDISDGARKAFARWYGSRILHRDPFRSSFQSREDDHILRVAALLSVNDGTWVIQQNHILAGIKIVTQVREDGASIFEGTGSNSRIIVGIDKIRDKLLAAGINGLPQRELTKAVAPFMNAEHMKTALDIMHDMQMVQCFENIQVGRGRPATLWRATSNLISPKALDSIVERYAPSRS